MSDVGAILDYANRSLHKGMNTRKNGRLLDDTEASFLLNADITIPGNRTKKMSPLLVTTLGVFSGEFLASPNKVFIITVDDDGLLGLTRFFGAQAATIILGSPNFNWELTADDDGELGTDLTSTLPTTTALIIASDNFDWLITVDDNGILTPIRQ